MGTGSKLSAGARLYALLAAIRRSPIVLRLYQLKADAAFINSDYFPLFDDEKKVLGGDLLSREEQELSPGQTLSLEIPFAAETRFIAVAGGYQDSGASWRAIAPAAGSANWIDVTDNVRHRDIRRREFLHVTQVAGHPCDRSIVALAGDAIAARTANGSERVVIDFAASHYGNFRVQKVCQATQDAALGLPAQT